MEKVRTRFAPSPTGRMHVGNLRTALYTYLIAKHEGGDFILRIEDTDQERFVEGALDIIYHTLKETGLVHDEGPDKDGGVGPYVQSERNAQGIYLKYAKQLIKENKDFRQLLSEPDIYQEETLLRSYIIGMGTAKEKDFKKALKDFNTFVPLVNNWAVNDSFCVEFRVMDMFRDEFLPYIKECIESFDEYRARVGLIMLLDHYLKVDMHGMKRPRMKKVTIKDIESTDEINCANGLYLDL